MRSLLLALTLALTLTPVTSRAQALPGSTQVTTTNRANGRTATRWAAGTQGTNGSGQVVNWGGRYASPGVQTAPITPMNPTTNYRPIQWTNSSSGYIPRGFDRVNLRRPDNRVFISR